MRLSSEVMTCGFDRWEETMQHMILVTNNGREAGPPRGGGRGGKIPGARRLLGARQGPAGPGRAPNVNIVNIIWARDCSI